jgi:hypothetical protein
LDSSEEQGVREFQISDPVKFHEHREADKMVYMATDCGVKANPGKVGSGALIWQSE